MTEIVIAHFSSQEVANLAASFLRRHGVKTRVPSFYFAQSLGTSAGGGVGEHPVIVQGDQVEKARQLLNRVLAGEFAEEGVTDNPRQRLGAKLSEALLPVQSYKAASRWVMMAPILCIMTLILFVIILNSLPRIM